MKRRFIGRMLLAALILGAQSTLHAAVDSESGPPPCGQDGICNLAVCVNDPDCPESENPPDPPRPRLPDRPEDFVRCSDSQRSEIGQAVDWGADNWLAFEAYLEGYHDWPVNIGNCLENRFRSNGVIECESSSNGMCNGSTGWASPFNRRAHFCPTFLDTTEDLAGADNRKACYFALATHEWSHTCMRGHVTIEILDGAAMEFWKLHHPAVTVTLRDCDMG